MNAEQFGAVLHWLRESKLEQPGPPYDLDPEADEPVQHGGDITVSLPIHRVGRKSKEEIKKILKEHGASFGAPLNDRDHLEKIWEQSRKPHEALSQIDIHRLPAEALAFYRPFHVTPHDSWGIYLIVPRILRYTMTVADAMKGRLLAFTSETLAAAVLFEIFHHEFFHHIVECLATDLEMFFGGRQVYWPYFKDRYKIHIGTHRHHPLEEALANSYAYNSLSFISRVKTGYRDTLASMYQDTLIKVWQMEPAGYRDAANYVGGGFIEGGGELIRMMLAQQPQKLDIAPPPFSAIAASGLPGGHTAYFSKPTIPTYLIGSPDQLALLNRLVPAPLEACTNLFWPGKTENLDAYILHRRKELKEKRGQKVPKAG